MTQGAGQSRDTAMEGGGFYNQNSALQASGISLLLNLWSQVCRAASCSGEPLTIVDYASSQGRNSMLPMRIAIKAMRDRTTPETPIEIIHTDLPSNDFSALFLALEEDANSYLENSPHVYPAAIGRNYFQPLFPEGRVNLGWNTFSLQWLSKHSAAPSDHIVSGLSQLDQTVDAVHFQQAEDWKLFLKFRAAELRPGAKLLTAFTGKSEGLSGWEWLCNELWSAAQDMGRDGSLSAEDLTHLTIPIGFRTVDEIKAPFKATGRFAGLELEHVEYLKIPDPFWEDFQKSADSVRLAQRHRDLTRAWAAPTLMGTLSSKRHHTLLIDELFKRFGARVSANPRQHEPWMAVCVLAKT